MSTANFSVLDACQHRPWHYLIEPVENAQSRRELMSLSDRELSDKRLGANVRDRRRTDWIAPRLPIRH